MRNHGPSIHDRACGKWAAMLPQLGIDSRFLNRKHGPCPLCGGKDRWRFIDEGGRGNWWCNHCGHGSGVDLVMKVNGLDFITAKKRVEELLGDAPIAIKKAGRSAEEMNDRNMRLWKQAQSLNGVDPASRYLMRRGIAIEPMPMSLRFAPRAIHKDENGVTTYHPAMVACYAAPDMATMTLHYTYLTDDGGKAKVDKEKKLLSGKVPRGGAVRLAPSASIMGIAEGIETALSASQMFDMPVWAALSAPFLLNWQPPPTARSIVIFGDNDRSFAGQNAAYSLAYRLRTEGLQVDVRMPRDVDTDWNDVLKMADAA